MATKPHSMSVYNDKTKVDELNNALHLAQILSLGDSHSVYNSTIDLGGLFSSSAPQVLLQMLVNMLSVEDSEDEVKLHHALMMAAAMSNMSLLLVTHKQAAAKVIKDNIIPWLRKKSSPETYEIVRKHIETLYKTNTSNDWTQMFSVWNMSSKMAAARVLLEDLLDTKKRALALTGMIKMLSTMVGYSVKDSTSRSARKTLEMHITSARDALTESRDELEQVPKRDRKKLMDLVEKYKILSHNNNSGKLSDEQLKIELSSLQAELIPYLSNGQSELTENWARKASDYLEEKISEM